MKCKNKKRRTIIIRILLVILLVLLVGVGILWNRYVNKNQLVTKFESVEEQEIYLLGTFHEAHFNKWANYSMEDLISVVENIKPDVVFIEAREEMFIEYGVVDGPIDMVVIYSYCIENEIDVEFIDWWEVTNDSVANSTNDVRDDYIFHNIESKLASRDNEQTVLVVCGAGHFYEQKNRFIDNDYENVKLKNRGKLFDRASDDFVYPDGVEEIWDARSYFYAYTHSQLIRQEESLNEEVVNDFTSSDKQAKYFYEDQLRYCDLFINNDLYE